ncbi:MAG: glycosyltransferase family 2 protein [Chloroflexi bacterium]|nr:glycosyltransferase family 2 protein [Chloroflexota bacterium]
MISVVIPAYNATSTLHECLHAIGRSDYGEYEVVVVDDGSTDNTAGIATQYGCRVVRLQANVGAAQAKNLGVDEARGDIIVFTDADIVVQPNTLSLVAENLRDAEVAGVVGLLGPKLRYANFASQFKNLWMYHTYAQLAESTDAQRGVGLFFTSIAAIRKHIFVQRNGFDAHYRGASVTEDIEFGQRLLTAGDVVRLDARLTVEHLKHYSLRELLKTDLQRAFGLTKTWIRKKLEPAQSRRAKGQVLPQKYYQSVPWSFVLSVPLAWLLPVLVGLSVWTGEPAALWLAGLDYAGILTANARFLATLFRVRGWRFLLQACLFLPVDLWVSGLGVLWAFVDYLAGNRY